MSLDSQTVPALVGLRWPIQEPAGRLAAVERWHSALRRYQIVAPGTTVNPVDNSVTTPHSGPQADALSRSSTTPGWQRSLCR